MDWLDIIELLFIGIVLSFVIGLIPVLLVGGIIGILMKDSA